MNLLKTFNPILFKNKKILVIGGTSGIGLAIAQGFAQLGGEVIACGSSSQKIAKLQQDAKLNAIDFQQLDVSNRQAINDFMAKIDSLDILMNAAGIARPHDEFTDEAFLEVMNVNLNSVMWLSVAAKPLLAKSGGSIINTSSMLSHVADPAVPAYGASKSGLASLTRHLAHAWAQDGIRVNAIAPGYIKTEMTTAMWQNEAITERVFNRMAIKRWGLPEDLVGCVMFLASPAATYITGEEVAVDGGFITGGY